MFIDEGYKMRADLLIEFLLYEYSDKRYVTTDAFREVLDMKSRDLLNAIRYIITVFDGEVLAYVDGHGTYEIRDLERYFDEPKPGAYERWTATYCR